MAKITLTNAQIVDAMVAYAELGYPPSQNWKRQTKPWLLVMWQTLTDDHKVTIAQEWLNATEHKPRV